MHFCSFLPCLAVSSLGAVSHLHCTVADATYTDTEIWKGLGGVEVENVS